MPDTIAEVGFSQAAFETFLAGREEPDWATELRRQAWESFQQLDWPSRQDEEWMRTDIRTFNVDRFHMPLGELQPTTAPPAALIADSVELGGSVVTVNSTAASSQLSPHLRKKGVVFCGMEEALREHGELVRRHLIRSYDYTADRLASLHAACLSGGSFLYVPRGAAVDQPLHVLSGLSAGEVDFSHHLIVLEDDAEATIMLTEEQSFTGEDDGLHCGASEAVLGRGSRLRMVSLQNWGHKVWHFDRQHAVVDRDARRCNGPSGRSERSSRRSTNMSNWPVKAQNRRSTASCSRKAASISLTTRCSTTPLRIAPAATSSTRPRCKTAHARFGGA